MLKAEDFQPLIGETFATISATARASLKLESVVTSPVKSADDRVVFSLFFSGRKRDALPQGRYLVKHEKLETTTMFISPRGGEVGQVNYQSLLSYIKEE